MKRIKGSTASESLSIITLWYLWRFDRLTFRYYGNATKKLINTKIHLS